MTVTILKGDCRDVLRTLPDESVHCVVTSPPYFGLRDYGVAGQIGLERTPNDFVYELAAVFRETRRVLRSDGTCWLNLGDSYSGHNLPGWRPGNEAKNQGKSNKNGVGYIDGLKPKDLIGIPWRVAFALQADGWWFREDIIWAKRAPMPEPVKDRCTRSHEFVFHLSKSERYFHDWKAIAEDAVSDHPSGNGYARDEQISKGGRGKDDGWSDIGGKRNARSVWTLSPEPYPEAHFATMPPTLAERCILAGCPKGGTVLDPFGGAGTTALVADRNGRNAILIELNPEYAAMAERRIRGDAGMFSSVEFVANATMASAE